MDRVMDAGLAFLRACQAACGRFPSVASGTPDLAGDCYDDETPFVAAFLCPALAALGRPEADELRERALVYLIDRSEPPGVWRYWRNADHVLDPDLDDTACASAALSDRHLAVLCGANRPLILGNRDSRGRFKTWLRAEGRPNDVDSVVNANVVAYLGQGPGTGDAIRWLTELVAEDRVAGSSRYYLLEHASLAYAMARGVAEGVTRLAEPGATLCRRLLDRRRPDGSLGSVLETAMTVTASIAFGAGPPEVLRAAADALRRAQRPDGSWRREAFYCGPEPPGPRSVYFGSEALTTGLCLEAVTRVDAVLG